MSTANKQLFLNGLCQKLSEALTPEAVNMVAYMVANQMDGYMLEESPEEQHQISTEEYLDQFILVKTTENKSPKTIERYKYILTKVLTAINVPIPDITVFHLRKYLGELLESGKADSTVEGVREVICTFFGWLQREGLIPHNPAGNLSSIKVRKRVKLPFMNWELEKLKEHCECIRDKAVVTFLLSTGCRISEVCGLNRSDIDFSNNQCVVLGKGEKERTVYIDDVAAMFLARYLRSRVDDNEALFIGKGSTRMTPGGIRFMLRKLSAKAGVENVHPHRFRRTFATGMINHGMNIEEVANLLGHEKVDTTMKYIWIDPVNVKSAYKKSRAWA